jgi:hypothetical protein
MNERKVVRGIFCDLQKAFDCINHNILLRKLYFYGVTGTILKLITCYLEGNAEVILYADDTNIIITSLNRTNFTNSANKIIQDINKCLTTNCCHYILIRHKINKQTVV